MKYFCPCCGFKGLDEPAYKQISLPLPTNLTPPYYKYFGDPTYDICECCGFEFGYDDEPGAGKGLSFEQYLQEWINDGQNWFVPSSRPDDWALETQLKNIKNKKNEKL